jgi:hypothetical protein
VRTITIENAGFELALVQWLVLRHELPDQHVLDHRITASYGLIAPLVTMSCRVLLRRAASRGVLPRERFRPLALSGIGATPRFEFVVRSKADVGERNSDLLRKVKLNRGRPMAMADSF